MLRPVKKDRARWRPGRPVQTGQPEAWARLVNCKGLKMAAIRLRRLREHTSWTLNPTAKKSKK